MQKILYPFDLCTTIRRVYLSSVGYGGSPNNTRLTPLKWKNGVRAIANAQSVDMALKKDLRSILIFPLSQ